MIEDKTEASQKIAAAKEEKAAESGGKAVMDIKVYSPFHTYYDEKSYSISGEDATGPFDILPRHHNFMALLEPCVLLIKPVEGNARERKIRISGGLMHVKGDKVTIFLDI